MLRQSCDYVAWNVAFCEHVLPGETEMTETLRVLFVDDDPAWLNAIRRIIKRSNPGWNVDYVDNGLAALQMIETRHFDVVVSDLNMPGLRGDSLLSQIAASHPEVLRFILSAAPPTDCCHTTNSPAMEFIDKESSAADLLFRIASGVSLRRFMNGQVVSRLVRAVSSLGELPNMTIRINSGESPVAGSASQSFIEISCPDLGLEFRTPLNG